MWTPELASNRLIGRTPTSLLMLTISAGYFLYDAAVSVLRYEGVAYLLHGVVSCCLYTYGALTGFLSYYGAPSRSSPSRPSMLTCMPKDLGKLLSCDPEGASCPPPCNPLACRRDPLLATCVETLTFIVFHPEALTWRCNALEMSMRSVY
jgi:hypothetical protein